MGLPPERKARNRYGKGFIFANPKYLLMKIKILTALLFALALQPSLSFSQNLPSYVPTNGLIGWWPFNGNANDESGNGNNGTVNGAVLTEDRYRNTNSAYYFDGLNDNIMASPNLPIGSAPRTVSSWFKTTASYIYTSQYNYIQNITGYGSGAVGLVIFPQHIRAPMGKAYFESGSGSNQIYSGNIVNDGAWHLLTTTYGGNNSKVKMYIDGQIQDSTANITLSTVNSLFGIGNAPWANIPFLGSIDDIGLWNRVLSEGEISNLYQSGYIDSTSINRIGVNTTNPQRNLHVKDVIRLEPRNFPPSNPAEGDLYYDAILHKLRVYDGTAWQNCW